jgi:hypothetical protein
MSIYGLTSVSYPNKTPTQSLCLIQHHHLNLTYDEPIEKLTFYKASNINPVIKRKTNYQRIVFVLQHS